MAIKDRPKVIFKLRPKPKGGQKNGFLPKPKLSQKLSNFFRPKAETKRWHKNVSRAFCYLQQSKYGRQTGQHVHSLTACGTERTEWPHRRQWIDWANWAPDKQQCTSHVIGGDLYGTTNNKGQTTLVWSAITQQIHSWLDRPRPTLQTCSPLGLTTVSQTSARCNLNWGFQQLTTTRPTMQTANVTRNECVLCLKLHRPSSTLVWAATALSAYDKTKHGHSSESTSKRLQSR